MFVNLYEFLMTNFSSNNEYMPKIQVGITADQEVQPVKKSEENVIQDTVLKVESFGYLSKFFKTFSLAFTSNKVVKVDVFLKKKEFLQDLGLKESIIKKGKEDSISRLIEFMMSAESMKGIVVDMINEKGDLKIFEKAQKMVKYQQVVLFFMGVEERAIGLDPTFESKPSDEQINHLYLEISKEIKTKDKIIALIPGQVAGIKNFFEALKGYQELIKKEGKIFHAPKFYEELSSFDVATRIKLMSAMRSVGELIAHPHESDKIYLIDSNIIVLTKKGEAFTEYAEFAAGTYKNVFTLLKINDFVMSSDKVLLRIKKGASKKNKSENEASTEIKIFQKLQGSSRYIAPPFELVLDSEYAINAIQDRMSGKSGNRKDGTGLCLRPYDEILKAYAQAAIALLALHVNEMVHGDFKPANFMFDKNDDVRLADFGFTVEGVNEETILNRTSGTLTYMAPETTPINKKLSQKSDSFSLGVSILESIYEKYKANSNLSWSKNINNKFLHNLSQDEIDKLIKTLKIMIEEKKLPEQEEFHLKAMLDIARGLVQIDPSKRSSIKDVVQQFHDLIEKNKPDMEKEIDWEVKKVIK